MIKIIKNGRDPSRAIYVTTCDNCDCEFIFHESDTEEVSYSDYQFCCFAYTVKCPCCGEMCLMSSLKKYRGKRGGINE